MRRQLAGAAEVIRIARDCLTEMPLPDAVHDHARRQRVFPTGNPLRQFRASTSSLDSHRRALLRACKQAQHARAHFALRRFDRAALENVDSIVRVIGHRERQRRAALELKF